MEETRYRFYVREFLNKPGHHSTGHILSYVTRTAPEDKWSGDVSFTLADCSRQIDLSFDLNSKACRENSLYKLDMLIRSLQQFRKAFKAECDLQDDREHLKKRLDAAKKSAT